ncbi:hypothetical protein AMAG_16943 [Allomyces macrogynus ATCC 38327]|uniref:Ran GTPase-activating protein 1 n=1 Tax=Allomyces macrogynus (strain ATCC 38327) TaxID=578462 RepID=A0A0L0TDS8_ALLM3|nr:hypothetical protein AMAG_16943 [Allomyces macrogynus ATCC 38327]|eukprot:KNE72836.1 hypothetical protein AMAG_16943 [Allomyces macrogynus ATCC 38327]
MSTIFRIPGQGLKFDTAKDVEVHAAKLQAMTNVTEVHLSGHTFGIEAAKAIGAALVGKKDLKVCNFSDMFTGRLKSEIPACLTALTEPLIPLAVHTLDLSDNAFGPAGAFPIVPFLSQTTSLHTLRLNNNGLGQGGQAVADALAAQAAAHKAAGRASPLRVFVAGRNRLENGSMPKLAAAFAAHGNVEHVQIPQNGIRPEGIAELVAGLKSCKGLKVLDVQDNTLTKAGAAAVAEALPSWPHLRKLHLGDCLLTAKGAAVLFKAMRAAKVGSIEELHLGFNEINAKGASLLGDWLRAFGGKVTLLELNGNCFEAESDEVERIKSILEGFGHEDALDELDEMEELSEDEADEDEADEDEEEADELTAKIESLKIKD